MKTQTITFANNTSANLTVGTVTEHSAEITATVSGIHESKMTAAPLKGSCGIDIPGKGTLKAQVRYDRGTNRVFVQFFDGGALDPESRKVTFDLSEAKAA